ncbi:MAG: hypothetical protein NVSMB64_06460 [Candidatus Velthaea sp.]
MRTLTEVFAPGSPSLSEGLRTLVVSPDRTVEPGTTVRAAFAFYNLGGAAATGLRVRFSLPDGLRYLAGSARIDDAPLDEARGETALLGASGADIGEVPPGVERRIAIAYLVNSTIENNATIELQAALASHETGVIGSNVVRLVCKSTPILQNPATVAALEPVRSAEPGEELRVTARVYNSGQSSARDVVVVLPLPDRTTYVPGSARIDGREAPHLEDRADPFGFAQAPIAAATLAAGATLVVEYRARIDSPLENNTRLFVAGEVASAEIAEFDLARAEISVHSASRFDGEDTLLMVDAPSEVEPGRRIHVALIAQNTGTCAAADVRLRLTLPEGLQYAPGSRAVDGRSVGESDIAGAFSFERIDAGQRIEVAVDAYVVSPAIDGTELPTGASLAWSSGSRSFDRTLTVRSKPQFAAGRNSLVLDGSASVAPAGDVRATIRIVNDGTAPATNARITIDADSALQSLRYVDDGEAEARVQNGTIALGTIEPNVARDITVIGTIASPISDRTEIRFNATLIANETPPLALGTLTLVARSRSRFTLAGSHLAHLAGEALRPGSAGDVAILLTNEGTDVARDVRLTLDVSADARIDGIDGATRDGDTVIFGDILPGARAEATLRVRLARFVARGTAITIHARVAHAGFLPFALEPLTIATLAEPDFADGAQLRTQPIESVDAGEAMYVHLTARNTGDGSASRLIVRATLPENTAYVPGSTSINDVPLLDVAGSSVMWSKAGLVLEDVDPGVEISVRYCVIINTPLPAGTLIAPSAELSYDGGASVTLGAPAVRVRSTPAFAVRASGLPFSVAGVAPRTVDVLREVAQSPAAPIPMLPPRAAPPRVAPGRAAVPVVSPPPEPRPQAAERAAPDSPEAPVVADATPEAGVQGLRVRLTFTRDALERALAFMEQSEYGGLVTHLFVLRTLFPDGIAGINGDTEAKFATERDALRGVVDRLFIKMRMPRYALTGKDLEDRAARVALVDLVGVLRGAEPGAAFADAPADIVLEGAIDRDRIVTNLGALESEPLGSARPWLVLAELLASRISWPSGSSDAIGAYRTALVATLMNVASLPIEEFHRVLTGSKNTALDVALGDVRAALRDALEATATVPDRA